MKLVAVGPVSVYGLVTFRQFGDVAEVPDDKAKELLGNKRLHVVSMAEFETIPVEDRNAAACLEVIRLRGKTAPKKPKKKEEVSENGR